MAKLTQHNGKGYVNRDDGAGWVPLSPSDYSREQIYQNHVQGMSPAERAWTGAGKYAADTISGISQLGGGPENEREQQQKRTALQQQYQSFDDYGGIAPDVGAFALGMVLTPPDVISQTLLALPMWILFEIGIIFSRILVPEKEEETEST